MYVHWKHSFQLKGVNLIIWDFGLNFLSMTVLYLNDYIFVQWKKHYQKKKKDF